ncbi:hypothetical protein; putative signal peptide [Bradyrhizobium sp. ORS 278]|uniref:substrate-binding domain-containing protein n=1 Tax=Bradyrhizobium sp. (strain ORS 278) TaxID=114615 RepID=UPI0001508F1C|nr:substrate-binding domain-containing protein [Bradyrhizobium sp. ORS 278]CAL76737.1 hypothetical protein; putative signal peptide [Bradyrhizobium sp. ORS 278]
MRRLFGLALIVMALTNGLMTAAEAQTGSVAIGVGSWRPAYALRQLFDCFYDQAKGGGSSAGVSKPGPWAKAANCPMFNGSGAGGEILYVSHLSADTKQMLRVNSIGSPSDPANTKYCLLPCAYAYGSSAVPYTDATRSITSYANYDGFHFIAGEAPVSAAEMTAWAAAGNLSKYGRLIQIPMGAAGVALMFGGKDGNNNPLNMLQPVPSGGSSGLNLSRNALCGIYSGHITKWDNPILTALNGGVLGGGQITIYASTGGMNYLLTSALASQCQFEIGPNNETDPTLVSYAFPWTDRDAPCPNPPARGALSTNWPTPLTPQDQCGKTNALPAGMAIYQASLPGSEIAALTYPPYAPGATLYGTPGSIAAVPLRYINTTIVSSTLKAINIESEWDLATGSGQFQPPTWQGAEIAMAQAVPQLDDATRLNPLAWSLAGQVPNPVLPGAYPISGFTWIEMYQCYANHANGTNPFLWLRSWLDYLYGSDQAEAILRENGFVGMSPAWKEEIYKLLNDPANGPAQHGNSGCTSVAGAY